MSLNIQKRLESGRVNGHGGMTRPKNWFGVATAHDRWKQFGGQIEAAQGRENFYHDLFVLAYRSPQFAR